MNKTGKQDMFYVSHMKRLHAFWDVPLIGGSPSCCCKSLARSEIRTRDLPTESFLSGHSHSFRSWPPCVGPKVGIQTPDLSRSLYIQLKGCTMATDEKYRCCFLVYNILNTVASSPLDYATRQVGLIPAGGTANFLQWVDRSVAFARAL